MPAPDTLDDTHEPAHSPDTSNSDMTQQSGSDSSSDSNPDSSSDSVSKSGSDKGSDKGSNSDAERDLTQGAVWKTLAIVAGPMVFGIAAVLSVSLVDTLFVGRLGPDQLAALSFAFPVTTVVSGLALGLGAAAASVVSRKKGEDDAEGARRMSLHAMLLALLVVGAISLAGALLAGPLFELLGASEDTLDMIVSYMRVWFISMPFLALTMQADSIVRAVGNSVWPSIVMSTGSAINIAATAVLVFGLLGLPELGIVGAAAGTLFAQVVTVFGSFWLITYHTRMIDWHWPGLSKLLPNWADIGRVAGPAALGSMVNPFSITVLTALLAGFSEAAVASFGVANQVESVATIPLLALSAAMAPIAGQCWGADNVGRIRKTLWWGYGISVVWAAVAAAVLWVYGEAVAGLFTEEEEIAEATRTYLRIVPWSLFGFGMLITAAAAFNGIDRALHGLGYYVVRAGVLLVPMAFLGAQLAEEAGVYAAIAAANVVGGLAVAAYALYWLRKNADKAAEDREEDGQADGGGEGEPDDEVSSATPRRGSRTGQDYGFQSAE